MRQALIALAALALVGLALFGLGMLFAEPAPARPPARNPFGVGVREAAPAASGLVGWILDVQSSFYRAMTKALSAMRDGGSAAWGLIWLGFAYGVFHAAGPGHGKAVISAYLVANERSLVRGVTLSAAAALLQALVAIVLVGVAALVFRATARGMTEASRWIEIASFAAVALFGLALTWRKAGALARATAPAGGPPAGAGVDEACCATHALIAAGTRSVPDWRERLGVIVAAGLRPCSGAIIVLVFALSQKMFPAGIAATFAMAAGTALTTSAFAALAVFAKGAALGLAGGRPRFAALGPSIELAAAAFVAVLGVGLVSGLVAASGG
jgi:ABC-type nickel/cobalt efflux system permease component RcnA